MRKPETYTDKSGVTQVGSIELTADYIKFVPFGKVDQSEEGQQGSSGKRSAKSSETTGDSQFGAGQGVAAGFSDQGFGRQGNAEEDNLPF